MSVECNICGGYFDSPSILLEHKAIYHKVQEKAIATNQTEPGKMSVIDFRHVDTNAKRCNHCKQRKTLNEFNRSLNTADGLQPRCKECAREYNTRRYEQKKKEREKVFHTLICPQCGKTFKNLAGLSGHQYMVHKKTELKTVVTQVTTPHLVVEKPTTIPAKDNGGSKSVFCPKCGVVWICDYSTLLRCPAGCIDKVTNVTIKRLKVEAMVI